MQLRPATVLRPLISAVIAPCLFLGLIASCDLASGQPAGKTPAPLAMMRKMAGNWSVRQRTWQGAGAKATDLPPAIARRRLVSDAYLEEVMELDPGSHDKPFTRSAFFSYNATSRQYEYFSLDTRLPQMMNERSRKISFDPVVFNREDLPLYGGRFVAPQWGKAKNVAFTYRLSLGTVQNDRQLVRLYLTPQSGKKAKEFVAFEYVYSRTR